MIQLPNGNNIVMLLTEFSKLFVLQKNEIPSKMACEIRYSYGHLGIRIIWSLLEFMDITHS